MIDFNNLIDNYLRKEFRAKSIGRYYPSEIGGCMRKTWFSYKKPKQTDSSLMRIFEAGNMIHDFIVDVLKSDKNKDVELLKTEMPIKINEKEFTISGRIDDLVLVKINNTKYLVEVKSCKFLPEEPRESHLIQLQLYMHAIDIHQGMILYIQKDKLDAQWFNVKYSAQVADKIINRFRTLHNYLTIEKMPDAEAKIVKEKSWLCKNCEYAEECEEAG